MGAWRKHSRQTLTWHLPCLQNSPTAVGVSGGKRQTEIFFGKTKAAKKENNNSGELQRMAYRRRSDSWRRAWWRGGGVYGESKHSIMFSANGNSMA